MLLGDVGILISSYNINLNPPKNNKLCTFCLLGCFHKKGSFCRICICSASFGKCLPRSFLNNTTPNYLITGTFSATPHVNQNKSLFGCACKSNMIGFEHFKKSRTVFWPLMEPKVAQQPCVTKTHQGRNPDLRLFDSVCAFFAVQFVPQKCML